MVLCPILTEASLREMISDLSDMNSFSQVLKSKILADYDSGTWNSVVGDQMCQLELIAANIYTQMQTEGTAKVVVYNLRTHVFSNANKTVLPVENITTQDRVMIYNGINHHDATTVVPEPTDASAE